MPKPWILASAFSYLIFLAALVNLAGYGYTKLRNETPIVDSIKQQWDPSARHCTAALNRARSRPFPKDMTRRFPPTLNR